MMEKSGLGRGLGSLIPQLWKDATKGLQQIPVNLITPNPGQPRKTFDPEALAELVESIRAVGIIQPLLVRSAGSGFEIIAGERRWMAAIKAGLKEVPALIRDDANEEQAFQIALIENIQRVDLNPIEEASAYRQIISDSSISQAQLARQIGKSRSDVANTLRLLSLPQRIKKMLVDGLISEGHARAMLALDEESQMIALAKRISDKSLSVRQTEEIMKERIEARARRVSRENKLKKSDVKETSLEKLPFSATITRRKNKIFLKFTLKSDEELKKIVAIFTKGMKG